MYEVWLNWLRNLLDEHGVYEKRFITEREWVDITEWIMFEYHGWFVNPFQYTYDFDHEVCINIRIHFSLLFDMRK